MWKLCPVIPKQDHRYFNDNYYNCLVFAELQKKSLFLSLLNAVGRIFLSTLGCDSRSVDLEAPFICEGDLWLAQPPSSSSLSIAFGLAKLKENQLGNQRGSYSQKTEERGFRCGLCCHWTNGGKGSKREQLPIWLFLIGSSREDARSLLCHSPQRPTMGNVLTEHYPTQLFTHVK